MCPRDTPGIECHRALDCNFRPRSRVRPVTFRYKQNSQDERQYKLIAEEVARVYLELVS